MQRLARGQGPDGADAVSSRQRSVEQEPDAEVPARARRLLVIRKKERQRPHQVRSEPEQESPLLECFPHQPESQILQIADAAVDQARRATARPSAEVAALEQRDAQAAKRGVASDADTLDPSTDDDEVVPLQGAGSPFRNGSLGS